MVIGTLTSSLITRGAALSLLLTGASAVYAWWHALRIVMLSIAGMITIETGNPAPTGNDDANDTTADSGGQPDV